MIVESLHIYPVKSLRGIEVASAELRREGFANDRRWVVTDNMGILLTQREIRTMAQVSVNMTATGIELAHENFGNITAFFPKENAKISTVTVWHFSGQARRADMAAEEWLSTVLGQEIWLSYMHDVSSRPVKPEFGRASDRVSFADGYPLLIANSASLRDLNRRDGTNHIMRQFRPNIVVDCGEPWIEDTWRQIRIGGLNLRIAELCARCVMTTLNPLSGEQGSPDRSPLAVLGKFHRSGAGKIMFGQNAIADNFGTIQVGESVEVLETGQSGIK